MVPDAVVSVIVVVAALVFWVTALAVFFLASLKKDELEKPTNETISIAIIVQVDIKKLIVLLLFLPKLTKIRLKVMIIKIGKQISIANKIRCETAKINRVNKNKIPKRIINTIDKGLL
ncbi:MAG: hypothetical protein NTV16_02965 [Actinobacteria bacterium]|nr:hypothetical protein [Actinomycetota bacterium]